MKYEIQHALWLILKGAAILVMMIGLLMLCLWLMQHFEHIIRITFGIIFTIGFCWLLGALIERWS